MNNITDYFSRYEEIIKKLRSQGAFLTVKDRSGRVNVMTIGWGLMGIMWRDPVFMVAIRSNRYTFGLLENADDFTVTIPFSNMSEQLVYCGTHSGSKVDKFKECNLRTMLAENINSPVLEIKNSRQYECKIVQMSAMDKNRLNSQYDIDLYQDHSYHTYFFGKIVACYEMNEL
jgi:flavin reductase (DIM6/NTAB) family NADH-FMN oxidoreductase RutF